MKNLLNYACLIAGLLGLPGAPAADDAAQPRQYDIELLVFRNLAENDGGEVWPVDYSTWYNEASDNAVPLAEAQPVQWLPESDSHLKAERAALDRSSRYRTLAYLAWRQPVYDRGRARPVDLPARPRSDAAWVDGSVSVAVERYLHLSLDLQLHLPGRAPAGAGDASAQAQLPEIRLVEQRRMRSRELHYFDNPRFGVIALITPYAAPPAASGDDAAAGESAASGAAPAP